MNREEAKRLLPAIQAYAEGKDVQFFGVLLEKAGLGEKWHDTNDPSFDKRTQWRVKPDLLECWGCGGSGWR